MIKLDCGTNIVLDESGRIVTARVLCSDGKVRQLKRVGRETASDATAAVKLPGNRTAAGKLVVDISTDASIAMFV
jgi:hypothetical protein